MRAARAILRGCAVTMLACLLAPLSAGAFYDNGFDSVPGAFLVSADYGRLEQGDDTTRYATISADGRYVAIETFSRNFFADDDPDPAGAYRAGGIFRFDLQTRALNKVADGNLFAEGSNAFLGRGAFSPSISAEGRYVAFSTAQRLVPADDNDNVDVYRRDMDLPPPASGTCTGVTPPPCPFVLVSARDGGEQPATYAAPPAPTSGGNPGSSTSRGVALSADGQRVAFITEAPSDLPAQAGIETGAGQIFVRDLSDLSTILVSAARDAGADQMTGQPAGGAIGAALSADGSTVAWTGANAAAQTRFLGGENTDPSFFYYLWRRAPFGAAQPTRRISGLADPDDLTCRQLESANPGMTTIFDATSTGPCYGPLTNRESATDITGQLPSLSGDGSTVAFLTAAGARPDPIVGLALDLFITRMDAGLSRKQATTELTRDAVNGGAALSSPVTSATISRDGRSIAVTSSRTQFSLPVLQQVGEPRAIPGPHELYVIDLVQHTIERAARSVGGGDVDGEVLDGLSLSADGGRIAFTSFAGNLFRGDANQRADAFVVTRESEPAPEGGGGSDDGGQSSIETLRRPHIAARLRSLRGGVAVLGVTVPAAGRIDALAKGALADGEPSGPVASGRAKATTKSTVSLTLRPRRVLLAALRAGERVSARAKVTYAPASSGSRKLHTSLKLTFFSKSSQLRHK